MIKLKKLSIVVVLPFMLFGCSQNVSKTPTQIVNTFLHAYQTQDAQLIDETSDWESFDASTLKLNDKDFIADVSKELQKDVYEKMISFQYKVNKEIIKEDTAVIAITLTLYDFDPTIKKGKQEATKKTEELITNANISDQEIQKQIITILFENMKAAKQNKTIQVNVQLIKKGNEWFVDNNNDELRDALNTNSKVIEDLA